MVKPGQGKGSSGKNNARANRSRLELQRDFGQRTTFGGEATTIDHQSMTPKQAKTTTSSTNQLRPGFYSGFQLRPALELRSRRSGPQCFRLEQWGQNTKPESTNLMMVNAFIPHACSCIVLCTQLIFFNARSHKNQIVNVNLTGSPIQHEPFWSFWLNQLV